MQLNLCNILITNVFFFFLFCSSDYKIDATVSKRSLNGLITLYTRVHHRTRLTLKHLRYVLRNKKILTFTRL